MAEQRYQAVLAVIKDGRTVTETAAAVGVSRQTLHAWLARYETGGVEGLVDGSHRPAGHPAQMGAAVEVAVLEARRRASIVGSRRRPSGSTSPARSRHRYTPDLLAVPAPDRVARRSPDGGRAGRPGSARRTPLGSRTFARPCAAPPWR